MPENWSADLQSASKEGRLIEATIRVQREGEPIEEMRPRDVVWFPPGEKHQHGAAPTIAMTHIAIQKHLDGKAVDWMEHVGDEQYLA